MMGYKVIFPFRDLTNKHMYLEGDAYPFEGEAEEARVKELSSALNKAGRKLIEEAADGAAEETKEKKKHARSNPSGDS
jgi:hypothetical protein